MDVEDIHGYSAASRRESERASNDRSQAEQDRVEYQVEKLRKQQAEEQGN